MYFAPSGLCGNICIHVQTITIKSLIYIFFINHLKNFKLAQNYQTLNHFKDFNSLNARLIILISNYLLQKTHTIIYFPYNR